ncbi:MAG: sigma 54-interacting transcriptional regulator [Sarcina sp.]
MKRIDSILSTLKKLDDGYGMTTADLAKKLNIERSNASKDLNILASQKKVFKTNSRPVKYSIYNPYINKKQNNLKIDGMSMLYPSLKDAITLSKTAIMYPPNGMNSLIIGDTGVGKSMLAKLMHEYFCTVKNSEIPFIHFNCSDYSTNPQLLVSQLFGVKKGAFTGANSDKAGLLEEADKGIIFLDEIHNLSNEGQEMLFLYMDTGYFRRLGDVSEKRTSSAMIICATNKDINTTLLDTFTRRIPIKISLPSLDARGDFERLTLIETFLKDESIKLNEKIYISKNALNILTTYKCKNNIGQLKNDITLTVANAYFEYMVHNKKILRINTPDLPVHIREITNSTSKLSEIFEKLEFKDDYICYSSATTILGHTYLRNKNSLLEEFSNMIIDTYNKNKTLNIPILNEISEPYIKNLYENNSNYKYTLDKKAFNEVIERNINKHSLFENTKFLEIFRLHIDMLYDRINLLNIDIEKTLNSLKIESFDILPFNIEEVISDIEDVYNVNLSKIEVLSIYIVIISQLKVN